MGQTRRYNRATFDNVTVGHETIAPETVTRACSKCRNDNPDPKHHYCPPCRATYMRDRRAIWKVRDSVENVDAAQPLSDGSAHE